MAWSQEKREWENIQDFMQWQKETENYNRPISIYYKLIAILSRSFHIILPASREKIYSILAEWRSNEANMTNIFSPSAGNIMLNDRLRIVISFVSRFFQFFHARKFGTGAWFYIISRLSPWPKRLTVLPGFMPREPAYKSLYSYIYEIWLTYRKKDHTVNSKIPKFGVKRINS